MTLRGGTITQIEAQARARRHLGERVNVWLDGKFGFAIDASLAREAGLEPGVTLSESRVSQLLEEDGGAKAYARALHFGSYRPRSAKEIRDRLSRDEYPPEVIERVLEKMAENGHLNDAAFAAAWVENRGLSKPRGTRALKQELHMKGVGRDDIEAALPDTDAELENALAAARPRLRRLEALEGREREQKLIEFLQRRGFGFGVARQAVRQLEEEGEEEE